MADDTAPQGETAPTPSAPISSTRLSAAKQLEPRRQGHFDGFCGLYALINAVRLLMAGDGWLDSDGEDAMFAAGIRFLDGHGKLSGFARYGLPIRLWVPLTAAIASSVYETSGVTLIAERPLRDSRAVPLGDVLLLIRAAIRANSAVIVLLRGAYDHYSVVSGVTASRIELFDSYGYAWAPISACDVLAPGVTARHRLHLGALTVLRAEYPVQIALARGPISLSQFREIEAAVRDAGYGEAIERSEQAGPPTSARQFAREVIYTVINGGMSNNVAAPIVEQVMKALHAGKSANSVFGHPGKAAGIDAIWADRKALYRGYLEADDRLAFSETIPWIGPVTRYHLAKIFGEPFAKPDVHLNRLARAERTTAQALCERLGVEAGYRPGTIDLILWRACADDIIDSTRKRQ